jgi:hypothetical protein
MSALSPAPAPTSGVRWTDLPTPLDSALPSCYLSYKQSAFLSPLCFHNLTNPFSRKSLVFTSIQIPRGVWRVLFPGCALCLGAPACPDPVGVANSIFSAACSLLLALSLEGFSLGPLFRRRVVCFQRLTTSFGKMPGGGGRDGRFFSSLVYPERSRGATRHSPLTGRLGSRSNA